MTVNLKHTEGGDRQLIYLSTKKDDRGFDTVIVHCDPLEREQLFRLLGYLEGVGAPKSMKEAYENFLALLKTEVRIKNLKGEHDKPA